MEKGLCRHANVHVAFFANKGKQKAMNNWKHWLEIIRNALKKFASGKHFPLMKFVGILFVTMIIFSIYSYRSEPVKVFKTEIKQSDVREFFAPSEFPVGMLTVNLRDTSKIQPTPMDSSSQNFLLIGDSMLETLGYRLNDYCRKNKHKMNSVIWYSSSTLWYGNCDTISYFINKFKPTYVILVIGANELFIRDIKSRDKLVKNIIRQVGETKYIWVGPPNWKEDTGINDLIVRNAGPRKYYPSKKLKYERFKDGAHPTKKSGYMWMDSVASFIMNKSMYPVLLNYPDTPAKKNPPTTLLGPHPPKGL
jgi:hypothetical protein